MRLGHARARRQVRLLAAGALDGHELEQARRHIRTCVACRAEHDDLRDVLALLERDPLRRAEPPLPLAAFAARVDARLDARAARRSSWWTLAPHGFGWLRPAGVALTAALALATVLRVPPPPSERASQPAEALLLPADSLQRLERRLAREQTARYLSQAEDVLVNVAAALPYCKRRARHVEVGIEAQRSRELLARRALVLEADGAHAAAAQTVLHDVERVLREVAAFEDCETRGRVEALSADIDQRRLLLRIALVERELQG